MGYVYFVVSLVLVPVLLAIVLRRRWVEPVWAAAFALTLLPALWATGTGFGVAPCRPEACVPKSEKHRQLFAAPAVALILLGVALVAFGVTRAAAAFAIPAGVLTLFAETKTDVAGAWFLGILVAAELSYLAVPLLQRRAAIGPPPG